MFYTPRRSPRKHAQGTSTSAQVSTHTTQTHWADAHERELILTLKDIVKDGVVPSYGPHLHNITTTLNSRIRDGSQYNKPQVKNNIKCLKATYKDFTDLISGVVGTGFGWGAETNTISIPAEQWIHLRDVRSAF
jgi:hypothetical protein